jgi:uncharacterized membrane protein
MGNYPEAVGAIVTDYMERVKQQLRLVPTRDRDEFLREIQSHVFEAYTQEPGEDGVARILKVFRNLGEPAEVVCERLPETMARQKLPLHIVAAVLIAIFGIPLGFGGTAVVLGVLLAVAGIVFGYFAVGALTVFTGLVLMLAGLLRVYEPEFWDRLIATGVVQMNGEFAQVIEPLSAETQGFFMLMVGLVFAGAGTGMLWLGKYLVRGFRFLAGLVFDFIRKLGRRLREWIRLQEGGIWVKLSERVL